MSAGVRISEYHSPRRLSSDFDEKIPDDFKCSITLELLLDPVTANCSAGHIFERSEITTWLQSNSTCPLDNDPITLQGIKRNRFAEGAIQRWKDEHCIEAIDSSKLADQILNPSSMSPEEKKQLAAHLRYVKAKDKTEEIADSVFRMAKEKHLKIPSSAKFQSMAQVHLQGNASAALEQILTAAASENLHDEIVGFVREAHEEKESQRERERKLAEENQRPLSTHEKAKVVALTLLPSAAAAAGRVMAAWTDGDPNTGFTEAFRIGAPDLFATSMSLSHLAKTWYDSGNAAVRSLSDRLQATQIATAMTSAAYAFQNAYDGTRTRQIEQRQNTCEANVKENEVLTKTLQERIGKLEEANKTKKWFWQ